MCMKTYLVLIRGVNVGGNSKVSMAELRGALADAGFMNVATYINSGNVILQSDQTPENVKAQINALLQNDFGLGELNKVLVLSQEQLQQVVDNKPKDFGDSPDKYYSDVIFLMDLDVAAAMTVFDPREGVDVIWPGKGVIYSQRLGAERTKSRLNKIIASPYYKSMTIRTWNTTVKLLHLMETDR